MRKIKDNGCVAICENSPCESFLVLERGNSWSHNFKSQATRSTEKKSNTADLETWHKRLGHTSNENIVHLTKHADGVIIKDLEKRTTRDESPLCEVCNTAVSHTHISRQPQYAGDRPFQRAHIDLIHEEPGLSNERYVFHFYCQKLKFNLAYVINDRKQKTLVSCFAQAHGMIKKWGYDIQFVRMDQEAGLHRTIWGVDNHCSSKNKTSIGFANFFWPYFVLAAVKIINRTPKKALGYLTPYELVTKRRSNLSGYRIPGSETYVSKRIIPALQKQASLSSIGYYISNSARNISIIWLPYANKVIASRDVRVDELSPFSCKDAKDPKIVPNFEDCTTTFEHGDRPAIDQLVEDLLENQAHKTIDITNRKLEQSQTVKELHENRENPTSLPKPRDTPEDLSKISRLSIYSIEDSDLQVSSTIDPK
ncbi:hypothetical protein GcM1_175014 [Golovinomyces cichoracearum]|uniref:Uncharacterized protein n=1 Tax=Golovinomyces cichoracearum TaxID=62708 RepID=A0A420J5K6_9PEZI|nr:hypothetical protein GcM1_175014 [Golovinomyces cichoracearum]